MLHGRLGPMPYAAMASLARARIAARNPGGSSASMRAPKRAAPAPSASPSPSARRSSAPRPPPASLRLFDPRGPELVDLVGGWPHRPARCAGDRALAGRRRGIFRRRRLRAPSHHRALRLVRESVPARRCGRRPSPPMAARAGAQLGDALPPPGVSGEASGRLGRECPLPSRHRTLRASTGSRGPDAVERGPPPRRQRLPHGGRERPVRKAPRRRRPIRRTAFRKSPPTAVKDMSVPMRREQRSLAALRPLDPCSPRRSRRARGGWMVASLRERRSG